jgi:16S rRNA (guanine527-N7)-methyltransferase
MARLEAYLALLHRWNPAINLVSRASLADAWSRHLADSAQLWRLAPADCRLWLDLGSGGGFPGLVIAILAAEAPGGPEMRLVESDQRKAAFLAAAVGATGVSAQVLNDRIESLPPQAADVVSARALAPLDALLAMVEKHRRAGGIGLFPKGETVHKELAGAARHWRFDYNIYPSLTDPKAAVVEIGALARE